jgi:hypothetical protein
VYCNIRYSKSRDGGKAIDYMHIQNGKLGEVCLLFSCLALEVVFWGWSTDYLTVFKE